MAITYVGGVTGGRAGATSTTTQSLSGTLAGGSNTSPSAGDLVVVWCSIGTAAAYVATSQTISGNNNGAYSNTTFQSQTDTNYSQSQLNYKIQGGTVDTSLTIPSSGNARNAQRWVVHVFRGVDSSTPLDVSAVPSQAPDTGRPNPTAINPSTAGAWIVAYYASAAGTGAAYTSPGLSGWLGDTMSDTYDCMQGGGYYSSWSSGSYDPPAITAGGTTATTDSWTGMTIALRPAPPPPPTVALNTPSDAVTITDTTPTVAFTGTSSDNYDLEYNVQIDTNNSFSSQFLAAATTTKTLASNDEGYTYAMTDDADYVYVSTLTIPARVIRINKSDYTTTTTKTLATGESSARGITNDANYVYVATSTSPSMVIRINKSDFSTTTTKTLSGVNTVYNMTDDADYLYVCTYTVPATVVRLNKSDFTTTATKTLGTGENNATSIINDKDYVYVGTAVTQAKIVRINKSDFSTTTTKTLATGEDNTFSITDDADYVYVSTYTTPVKVVRINKSDFSTTTTKTLATGQDQTHAITNDANYVYVATRNTPSAIVRINKSDFSTTTTKTLATGEDPIRAVTKDADYVYFGTNTGPAKIMRINTSSLISKFSVTDYSEFTDVTDGGDTHPYASGDQISYTVQSADILPPGIYYWRAAAIDPSGTNTYGSWSTARSFYVAGSTANGQYGANGSTAIAIGGAAGTAGYTTRLFEECLIHSPDTTQTLVPKVENKQLGTSFSNTATTTGTSMYVKSNDLPTMRRGAALTYDSINKRYISCGGYNGTIRFNDLWALSYYGDNNRPRWRKLAPSGTPPGQINMGASVQLNKNGKSWFVYWGGSNSSTQTNVMCIADCSTVGSETWTTPTQTNTPAIRSYINQHMVAVSTGTNTYDVYLFGGWGAARYNDLFRCSFDLSGSVPTAITWTTVKADGAAGNPSRRQSSILVHDSANNRLVLFGGYDGASYLADLWAFNLGTSTWGQLSPSGTAPTVREAANGAYDSVNQRMVVFGGWSAGTLATNLNDIVSISLVSGSESFTTIRANDTTNNGFQRASNGAACLDTDKRMIVQVFQGGVDLTTKYAYAFDLDEGLTTNATMYGLNVVDTFRGRDAPAFCVDTTRSKGLLTGGYGNMNDDTTIANGDHMNEMWAYDYSTNSLRYVNAGPLGVNYCEGSQACYDSVGDRVIVFGGLTALGQVTNDVWELKPDAFGNYKARRMLPTGTKPGPRWLSVMAFDAARNRVVIWSGSNSSGSLIANTDMWILDLSSGDGAWSTASPTGTPPPARWQAMFAYKESNNRLYIFSGCTDTGSTTFSTSTYYLDLTNATPNWVQPTTTSTVGVRGGVMAYDATNNYLIAFGGYNGSASNNTLSFLNLASDTNNWVTVTAGGTAPPARRSTVAWFLNGKFYVCAGRPDTGTWFSDVHELTPNYTTPSSSTWVNKSPADYQPVTTATTGLTNNANYHWQSWITIASADTVLSSFGGNAESATDFTIGTVGGATGIKVWDGNSWAYKPVKVWTGSSWEEKPVKVWDGDSWVTKG